MRHGLVLLFIAACANRFKGPATNEVVQKQGRKIVYRGMVAKATLCTKCGRDAPVIVRFADKVQLSIPTCYPHAESKVGDHDAIKIEMIEPAADATAGELDIDDCTAHHLVAKMWASFPDGTRVDAVIDTPLVEP